MVGAVGSASWGWWGREGGLSSSFRGSGDGLSLHSPGPSPGDRVRGRRKELCPSGPGAEAGSRRPSSLVSEEVKG